MTPKKRSKSFTGCFTCRRRKVRCDLARPFCNRCEKAGFTCEGYGVKLRWSNLIKFDNMGTQLPHAAYTAPDGEYFQRRFVDFVKYPKHSQYDAYEDMDKHLSILHSATGLEEENTQLLGPFGVFRGTPDNRPDKRRKLKENRPEEDEIKEKSDEKEPKKPFIQENLLLNENDLFGSLPNLPGHEWLSSELRDDALLTAAALNGDTQFLDFIYPAKTAANEETEPEEALKQDDFLNLVFHRNDSQFQPTFHDESPSVSGFYHYNENLEIHLHGSKTTKMPSNVMDIVQLPPHDLDLSIDNFGVPTTALQVSPLTRYLLNYYIENVADLMTVIPLTENPWKTIYFPRALQAIGDLAALGRTSNAKNTLLNALLAVSAFNLQSKFPKHSLQMKYYLNLGIQLRQQAAVFLKKMLEENILQQKYKDVLTAILSMVTIDVVWGTMSDCSYHLQACGKIITQKMINKKKLSPKARILHRVFSSLKLIQDSTNLDSDSINPEEIVDVNGQLPFVVGEDSIFQEKLKENANNKVRIEFIVNNTISHYSKNGVDDSTSTSPSFVNKKLVNTKKNDENFATDALYGLPNSLILLFSEIVKLVRLKIHYEKLNKLPNNFRTTSNSLEKKLLNWHLDWRLYKTGGSNKSSPAGGVSTPVTPSNEILSGIEDKPKEFYSSMHEAIYHHIMSFYHALVIYYYRLIKDLNSLNLQTQVEKTLMHLNSIQGLIEKDSTIIIPLFWQGFIAGCEAIDKPLQSGFRKWASDIAKYLGSYWGARQIMLEVWRRKENGEERDDWVSVVQDWEMNVMLN